jgi:branched-chain amino acid transport system ATP-binding protein
MTAEAATAQPALEVRGVSKLYGGLRAVADVSFTVEPGEVLGIAGPNGAGKTTLFDTITGHTIATEGEMFLGGTPIRGTKIHHRCRLGLARTFQHPVAAETLTALENTYLAASFRRGREGRSRSGDVAAGRAALEIDDTVALLQRLRGGGLAIVCIEHVMRALVALADRVLVMHHGAELFLGTPEAMMRDRQVVEVYLGASGGGAA